MDRSLLHACDINFFLANGAFIGTALKGEAVESNALFITNCGFATTEFNRAFLKEPGAEIGAALAVAEAYFADRELPFAVTVRSDRESGCADALLDAGYARLNETPVMVLSPMRDASKPDPVLEILEVSSAEDLIRFQETAFEGFGLPKQIGHLFITEQFQRRPGVKLYLGLVEGKPACTSALVSSPGIAGVYWVSTLEPYRGRGLGEAITWAAVRGGIESQQPVACLQASAMGEPVYTRMGFQTPVYYAKWERA